MAYVYAEESLCWRCKNATNKYNNCSWAKSFDPVDGWEAEVTEIPENLDKKDSYLVKSCPLFEKSDVFLTLGEGNKIVAKALKICLTHFCKNPIYFISKYEREVGLLPLWFKKAHENKQS